MYKVELFRGRTTLAVFWTIHKLHLPAFFKRETAIFTYTTCANHTQKKKYIQLYLPLSVRKYFLNYLIKSLRQTINFSYLPSFSIYLNKNKKIYFSVIHFSTFPQSNFLFHLNALFKNIC